MGERNGPLERSILQRHRVNRVINHVQSNVAAAMDLESLAEVACFSKYHFSRVFSAHVNETPLKFLWRTRLERAARNLVCDRTKPITGIALDCGFSSSQAFSYAFRHRYELCPRDFRSVNRRDFDGLRPHQRNSHTKSRKFIADPREHGAVLPVRIEHRPAYHVAYVRNIGNYGNADPGIGAAFHTMAQWARRHGLLHGGTNLIGLCPGSPSITPPGYCIYDVCIQVPHGWPEDEIVSVQTIPAGTYAMLRLTDGAADIVAHWEWLTTQWLPESDETYELEHCYEYLPFSEDGACVWERGVDLCMRVRPR